MTRWRRLANAHELLDRDSSLLSWFPDSLSGTGGEAVTATAYSDRIRSGPSRIGSAVSMTAWRDRVPAS